MTAGDVGISRGITREAQISKCCLDAKGKNRLGGMENNQEHTAHQRPAAPENPPAPCHRAGYPIGKLCSNGLCIRLYPRQSTAPFCSPRAPAEPEEMAASFFPLKYTFFSEPGQRRGWRSLTQSSDGRQRFPLRITAERPLRCRLAHRIKVGGEVQGGRSGTGWIKAKSEVFDCQDSMEAPRGGYHVSR